MHFLTLVSLGVMFISGIASAEYDESLLEIVKMIMCDPAFEEIRTAMESCSKDQDMSSQNEFLEYCGIKLSSLDMAGMEDYYCNTPTEDIKRDNECLAKKIKEMGKEEEMMKKNEPAEVKCN
ncbi:hypothetical protein AVEN_49082-1 [Araneus ventricosus]|uniref:DUF19 domain-containing protein n=1 Tax=Araneus ventricosus TaxID=182803 RepID=A0A4Y2U841_ARAVE|nr:hypothetical protein AVEN_49082-1 [Araneus ventricosus]